MTVDSEDYLSEQHSRILDEIIVHEKEIISKLSDLNTKIISNKKLINNNTYQQSNKIHELDLLKVKIKDDFSQIKYLLHLLNITLNEIRKLNNKISHMTISMNVSNIKLLEQRNMYDTLLAILNNTKINAEPLINYGNVKNNLEQNGCDV